MAQKSYDFLFKLLLIGDSGVGKTSILFRFSDDAFNTSFISTVGIDFKIKTMELNGKIIKLQVWDTAGQEQFKTITTCFYRGAVGVMMVYDITDKKSFDDITNWVRTIQEHANSNIEKIIIGNKCDMEDMRLVPKEYGEAVANKYASLFLETSAKANINIEEAFIQLVTCILEKKLLESDNLEPPQTL